MLELIYSWLKNGYKIHAGAGKNCYSVNMYYDAESGYIKYNHFGSSALEFSKKNLDWILKKIFDDVNLFWCIDDDENFRCTDPAVEFSCNSICEFEFYDRFENTGRPFMKYSSSMKYMLIHMWDVVEEFNKRQNTNHVHITLKRPYNTNSIPFNCFEYAV